MIGVDVAARGDIGKVAAYRHHTQMLCRELNLRVIRIKGPTSRGRALGFALCGHDVSFRQTNKIAYYILERQTTVLVYFLSNIYFLYGTKDISGNYICHVLSFTQSNMLYLSNI